MLSSIDQKCKSAYDIVHGTLCRIENEHLNNVGKYRAVKAVPLPFLDGM